jgi:hypothetical protein
VDVVLDVAGEALVERGGDPAGSREDQRLTRVDGAGGAAVPASR